MNDLLRLQDLVNNPTTRVPVCLCLDTSGSMGRIIGGDTEETGQQIYKDGQMRFRVVFIGYRVFIKNKKSFTQGTLALPSAGSGT